MANKASGLDVRGEEALLVRGRKKGAAFAVSGCELLGREGTRLASASEALGATVTGLTGRDLILRYVRVPQVPDWQLAKLMEFEVEEIATQAGGSLSSDYNLLPVANAMTGEDTVLLALAKDSQLQELSATASSGGGKLEAYVPNAVALYNAWLTLGEVGADDVTLIAWIGESAVDLALVEGANLLFARNVSGGLQVLDGAISQTFNVREPRARKIRSELLDLDPRSRGNYASSQEEKATHAVQGVAGQLQAALRSTIAFCQSQTGIEDIALQRCFLCGPGARIRGMAPFLAEGVGCRVEIWDPVAAVDDSACSPQDQQTLAEQGPEAALALGLALTPLFDELYSIEILPEEVKRKRRFQTRTIFNIAAALLAVAFLGYRWVSSQAHYEQAESAAGKLSSQVRRLRSVDGATKKLVDRNGEQVAVLSALQRRAVPLYGAVATMRSLRKVLPSDLWLTTIKAEQGVAAWVKDDEDEGGKKRSRRRKETRPYILVSGAGQSISGRDLVATFGKFKNDLMAAGVPVREERVATSNGFTFSFKVDWLDQ